MCVGTTLQFADAQVKQITNFAIVLQLHGPYIVINTERKRERDRKREGEIYRAAKQWKQQNPYMLLIEFNANRMPLLQN